jgi:DNA-binding Lrp family transcriptional regulator
MAPLRATGADIAKKVGMTADAVGKINRKLLKRRILIERGRVG